MPSTPYTYTSPDDPAREDEGLFGPESMTWRVMSNRIMWVAVVRALYLQALHPRVIRGTLQNAATITEPTDAWARLRRTRKFIETRTFGTTAEADRAGRRVRRIHDSLTGTARGTGSTNPSCCCGYIAARSPPAPISPSGADCRSRLRT
jgi:uncharacterized protein (DUF2236 family)